MRFNLVGPDLPRENVLLSYLTLRKITTTGWTAIICLGIIALGVVIRVTPASIANVQLDELKHQVQQAQMLATVGAHERSELLAYRQAAAHFGEVRDSGYAIAQKVVRVANLWPNPHQVPASLICYTPSDDGSAVTLTGVSANYAAYASTIASLQKQYLVVPSESPKGNRYEITLRVTQ